MVPQSRIDALREREAVSFRREVSLVRGKVVPRDRRLFNVLEWLSSFAVRFGGLIATKLVNMNLLVKYRVKKTRPVGRDGCTASNGLTG